MVSFDSCIGTEFVLSISNLGFDIDSGLVKFGVVFGIVFDNKHKSSIDFDFELNSVLIRG